ncbi:MAG TPA: hypothetical protein GX731_00665, partial [Clostridiales bacterium]|nr:hypothetical protein [Clostridiales bacterium]
EYDYFDFSYRRTVTVYVYCPTDEEYNNGPPFEGKQRLISNPPVYVDVRGSTSNHQWWVTKQQAVSATKQGELIKGEYNKFEIVRKKDDVYSFDYTFVYLNGNLVSDSASKNVGINRNFGLSVDYGINEKNISHLLDQNEGDISIDENIGSLPLPSQGISSPWDNKVIVPPQSVSEGVNLSPQDVLQQPAIDNFNNPVLDEDGNQVYEPIPQTWPNTKSPGYPPWPLSPDIEGVAEGTGAIGGILENIRDWIGDIGTFLTTDLPRILITDIPAVIENIFNGPPPGEEDDDDVTDKMNDYKLPDLFFLFLGVILAVIRLIMRFVIFIAQLLLSGPNSSMLPSEMIQGLEFLKNQNISYVNVSAYTLISGLGSFLFGLSVIKMSIKFVTNLHTGSNLIEKYEKTMEKMDKYEIRR